MTSNATGTNNSSKNCQTNPRKIYKKKDMSRIPKRKRDKACRRLFADDQPQKKKNKSVGPDSDHGQVNSESDEEDVIDDDYKEQQMGELLPKTSTGLDEIEKDSIGQSANPRWFQERSYRLTASNVGRVVFRRNPNTYDILAKSFVHSPFKGNKYMRWGSDNEDLAKKMKLKLDLKLKTLVYLCTAITNFLLPVQSMTLPL